METGLCHRGIFSLQPATQILPSQRGEGVWGGRGSLDCSSRSFSQLQSFPASPGSPVYFHQPELAVFYVVARGCFFY